MRIIREKQNVLSLKEIKLFKKNHPKSVIPSKKTLGSSILGIP